MQEKTYSIWINKEVVQLKAGQSFGELGLTSNKPRAASIFCLENTDFAVLDKKAYTNVIGKAFKRKLKERVDFLKSYRIFSNMSD